MNNGIRAETETGLKNNTESKNDTNLKADTKLKHGAKSKTNAKLKIGDIAVSTLMCTFMLTLSYVMSGSIPTGFRFLDKSTSGTLAVAVITVNSKELLRIPLDGSTNGKNYEIYADSDSNEDAKIKVNDNDNDIDIDDDNRGEYESTNENERIVSVLRVENKSISFSYSSCPDKVCINTGRITFKGQSAVCLPNRIMVRIDRVSGANGNDLDDTDVILR